MTKFLKSLTPNRVVIVITVIANVTGAIIAQTSQLQTTNGFIVALVGINAVALMFLKGWHQFEQAMYVAESMQFEHRARAEQVAQATAPRSAVKLPR